MAKLKILLEIEAVHGEAFQAFEAALASEATSQEQAAGLLDRVAALDVELDERATPVPMFSVSAGDLVPAGDALSAFSAPRRTPT